MKYVAWALLFVALALPLAAGQPKSDPVAMAGGGPGRNLVNTADKNPPTDWSVKAGALKNVKWAADLGKTSYGGPVVADGKVFVGTNNARPRDPKVTGDKGVLMCFRESDGEFLWQAVHDKMPTGNENDWAEQGIASCPAVDGKRVYYVSNQCQLVCCTTGGKAGTKEAEFVWKLDMAKDLGVYPRFLANSSPLVAGDLVYVLTGNGVEDANMKHVVHNPKAPSLIAVNKNTGKLVWHDASPGDKIMEGQWSSPAYANVNGKGQVIYGGGDGWLRGFDALTGVLIWKFDANPKDSVYKEGGRGDRSYFVAVPVVHDNKVYVGVGNSPEDGPGTGHLWCVDLTKQGDISPEVEKDKANPNGGAVWHFGGKAPAGGDRDWHFGRTMSNCTVHDGLLYAAEVEGFFHCLDAKTGKLLWTEDLKSGIWATPSWVDGKVYLGNEDGDMHIFAHGREKKALKPVEMGRSLRNAPVMANGVLYILTDTQLIAVQAK